MKKLLLIAILPGIFVLSVAAQNTKPTMAILDVVATNTSEVKSQVIYEYIVDVVNRTGKYTLVERSALQAAVKEMEISASGMIDDTTAARIGKLAGAELILISNLIVDDSITYLSTRIVSVESGQVKNTAMLQAEEGEYIASLANRTISQLLGASEKNKSDDTPPKVEVKKEPEKKAEITPKPETMQKETSILSKFFVRGGIAGIIPLLDDAEIFDIGYGIKGDVGYRILSVGNSLVSIGLGTGLFLDQASVGKGVVYPYNFMSIPLFMNAEYRLNMGRLFLSARMAAGGTLNMFVYTETAPTVDTTVISVNPAIFPGVSVGYRVTEKIGFSLFSDWSMTFFKTYPYTAVNAGIAVELNL